ncbi:MAG: LTA synthase family protein [Planctomycetota bacterium]|nr:LTA synthase family protein [Planctomycetota bacterium]
MDSPLPLPTQGRVTRLLRSRYGSLYVFGLVMVAVSCVLRAALTAASANGGGLTSADAVTVALAFLTGLAFDLAAAGACLLPAALVLLLAGDGLLHRRWFRWAALGAYAIGVYVTLFEAAIEWFFWDEFATRFNLVAVEHLKNTKEVLGNIWESYPVVKASLGILAAAAVVVALTARAVNRSYLAVTTFGGRVKGVLPFLLLPLLVLPAMRMEMAHLFANDYTNALAQNGPISFLRAFASRTAIYRESYVTRNENEVLADLRPLLATPNAVFTGRDPSDITRQIDGGGPEKKFNIVILTIESLSANYLGKFGNTKGLTPHVDALADKGLLLRNLYATGTRTIRGLEAITISLPPTPGLAVVKRPGASELFSVEHLLKDKGYAAKFIYGGRGHFDSMDSFLGQDGFEMIDRTAMSRSEVTFATTWGACDEDLYRRVLKECDKSHAAGKPFFVMSMTVSNHEPYEYPQTIDIPSGKGLSGPVEYLPAEGAVKYTDYAIGKFFEQVQDKPWFKDTVFLVVADHCARRWAPKEISPVKYHIPAIIYCPALIPKGEVNNTLCSQVDLVPTLLGMLNMSYRSKFFGRDLLKYPPGRAFVSTPMDLALITEGKLILLKPGRTWDTYRINPDGTESLADKDEALLKRAVTYYQGAGYLLDHHLYQYK